MKEQFSPVSVLDCPLFDDDEESTSPFSSPSRSTLEGHFPLLFSNLSLMQIYFKKRCW